MLIYKITWEIKIELAETEVTPIDQINKLAQKEK